MIYTQAAPMIRKTPANKSMLISGANPPLGVNAARIPPPRI